MNHERKAQKMANIIQKINAVNQTPSSGQLKASFNPESSSNQELKSPQGILQISGSKESLVNLSPVKEGDAPQAVKHVQIAQQIDETTLSVGSTKSNHYEKLDPRIIDKLFHQFKLVIRQEKGLDIALGLLEAVKTVLDCQRATLFPLDYYSMELMTKNLVNEKYSFIHSVPFSDEQENAPVQLAAIAKSESELCKTLIMKSVRTIVEDFIIKENGMKMAIVIKQCKGDKPGPSFIL